MITCGNCRSQHSTANQVRECYQGKTVGFKSTATRKIAYQPKAPRRSARSINRQTTTRWAKSNMDTDWKQAFADRESEQERDVYRWKMERDQAMRPQPRMTGSLVTEDQASFIFDLTNTIASLTGADGIKSTTGEYWGQLQSQMVTKQTASKMIDSLREDLATEQAKKGQTFAKVANGRYAIDEGGTIKFFKVNTPEDGRWKGFTFVDIMGSDTPYPIKNRERRKDILATIAQDPQGAMLRYGQELGQCGHCGRTLTNEESRERGIGPVCAEKMGW